MIPGKARENYSKADVDNRSAHSPAHRTGLRIVITADKTQLTTMTTPNAKSKKVTADAGRNGQR